MRTLAAILVLCASDAVASGGMALDAFNYMTGARFAGTGSAATAMVADPTALQWNPAGLARVPDYSASLSYLKWVSGITYSYLGGTIPVPSGFAHLPVTSTAGASLQLLDYGTIESTRGMRRAESAQDLGFTAGLGLRVMEKLSGGAAVKWFHHSLAGSGTDEAALDVGFLFEPWADRVAFAAVFQNIGYAFPLGGEKARMPTALKIGGNFDIDLGSREVRATGIEPLFTMSWRLIPVVDYTMQAGEASNVCFGAEARMNGWMSLRAGRNYFLTNAGSGAGFTCGLGVALDPLGIPVGFDWAYGNVGDLGTSQFVTLSWAPKKRKEPSIRTDEVVIPDENSPSQTGVADPEKEYLAALEFYNANRSKEAVPILESVVAARPDHWQAWQVLGNCRYALGDQPGALVAYRRSLEINPENTGLADWLKSVEQPTR